MTWVPRDIKERFGTWARDCPYACAMTTSSCYATVRRREACRRRLTFRSSGAWRTNREPRPYRASASLEAPCNSSMKHSPTILICLMAIPVLNLTACATVKPTSPTLEILRQSFAEIRRDPAPLSWPAIPDIDPEPLIGMPASAIRAALGHSDRRYGHYDWECGAPVCWVFAYDSLKPRPDPIVDSPTPGLKTVIVTTGGPPLLILGITRGRVISARWQGQK
jgi:hypothetical protein